MPDYSQSTFIGNWNQAAKILFKKYGLNVTKLSDGYFTGGACCGIAFALAEHIRKGEEAVFYDIYNMVCETDPKKLAADIAAGTVSKSVTDLIKKIDLMQEGQKGNSCSETIGHEDSITEIARTIFCSANHSRIGSPIITDRQRIDFDMVKYNEFQNLESVLEMMNNNDSMHISMFFYDLDEGHSVLAYKLNNTYHLFDMNVGIKVSSNNAQEAARELIYSTNLNYTSGTKKLTIVDKIRQSNLAIKIISYTVLSPIVFLWLVYDVFLASPLSDEQLKAAPLAETIELAWSIIKADQALPPSPTLTDSGVSTLSDSDSDATFEEIIAIGDEPIAEFCQTDEGVQVGPFFKKKPSKQSNEVKIDDSDELNKNEVVAIMRLSIDTKI